MAIQFVFHACNMLLLEQTYSAYVLGQPASCASTYMFMPLHQEESTAAQTDEKVEVSLDALHTVTMQLLLE